MPILPYERQLIELLGCSAEEYCEFRKEVMLRSKERPAVYDHIPDIYNGETAWAIAAIVISIGSTAASYFLAPRPDVGGTKQRNRQLDSIVGRDRFAPTFGFQSGQEISRYGESVPIVFTKHFYQGFLKEYIGGVMIGPKLVWSRSFSWGRYQSIDMVFLAGQGQMGRGPYSTTADIAEDKAGIYLGQSPIDTLLPSDYRWFYYQGPSANSNGIGYANDSRLVAAHHRHGTWGDNGPVGSAFYAPTFNGGDAAGFSHSFSPSTQLQFGVYGAIPNGTPLRLNWQVVSNLDDYAEETRNSNNAKRLAICGNINMGGTGRNYPRQIGIVQHNNFTTSFTGDNGELRTVQEGDIISVVFNAQRLQRSFYIEPYIQKPENIDARGIDNTEVITTSQSELEKFDEVLQRGTYFFVGNCKFIVESRDPADEIYNKRVRRPITVKLKCVEVYPDRLGFGRIGIVNPSYANSALPLPRTGSVAATDIGSPWFPLCQAELATFQNTRKCQYTEIGIRSNVWLRFNNLCNFTNLPEPEALERFDTDNISISSGTLQTYTKRASFFFVYVKPANASSSETWQLITDIPFCVTGSSPQDKFNFIRIAHNFDQFEFQLRPVSSAEIIHIIGRDQLCFRLSAEASFLPQETMQTTYGPFTVYVKGTKEEISDLAVNDELVNTNIDKDAQYYTATQLGVKFAGATLLSTGAQASSNQISNAISKAINKDADPNALETGFTDIPWGGIGENSTYTMTNTEASIFNITLNNGNRSKSMSLKMDLQVYKGGAIGDRDLFWRILDIRPINVTSDNSFKWEKGDTFTITKTLINPVDSVVFRFEVLQGVTGKLPNQNAQPGQYERLFEGNSAIAEVSHYGDLITRSCDNGPEHEVVYVNESLTPTNIPTYEGCAMAGLRIRSGRNMTQLEQLHLYQKNGVQVELVRSGNRPYATGSSNIFTDLVYYLLSNKQAGMGTLVGDSVVDIDSFEQTAKFLESNYLYYDDVIVEPKNLRDFIASIVPSLLCNLSTRNGKIAITPAIPHQATGSIEPLVDVPIRAMFTDGNIIEDSFELQYISGDDRKPFKASIRYRKEKTNQFPEEKNLLVYYPDEADAPIEQFDFTHITSRIHAEQAAKYLLSARRNVTHTISFKAVPYGIALAPGDYIRVVTQSNIFDPDANNGVILDDQDDNANDPRKGNFAGGTIVSFAPLADGNHDVFLWDRTDSEVQETSIFVQNGMAFSQRNAMFSLRKNITRTEVYAVESLQLDEDGMVMITASYFPLYQATNYSKIAYEVVRGSFVVESN